jgi:putative ABC transport system substrate-binding protein
VKRREFIAGLGAAAWPITTHAQQSAQTRLIGVLVPGPANDPRSKIFIEVFIARLVELGWRDGVNVRIEERYTDAKAVFAIFSASTPIAATLRSPT